MEEQPEKSITHKLPVDQEGFTISFDIDDFNPEAVKTFFQTYGIVIFNNVLNQEEIKKSIDDLWTDMEKSCQGKLKRKDPQTWDNANSFGGIGFVNHQPIVQPQLCKNRSHPKIYKAFKSLFQLSSEAELKEPLLALFDRGSILRPSKVNPDWKSPPFYHFDIHPWWWTKVTQDPQQQWRSYNKYDQTFVYWLGEGNYVPKTNNFTKIQGVLGLSDTNHESGGFECVCGFQNYIEQWCKKQKEFTPIEKCPQLIENMQKVYQRAGSVILFTRQLPHNIFPNLSENVRYAQYLRMAPQSSLMLTEKQKEIRKKEVKKLIHKSQDRKDAIVREVYMLGNDEATQEPLGFFGKAKKKALNFLGL